MTELSVIQAVFANHKRVASRKVVQIIMEVPEEQQSRVFEALGFPNSSETIWCAIAKLNPPEAICETQQSAEA